MRSIFWKTVSFLSVAALLSPLGLFASSSDCTGTPSSLSNTWASQREATELLEDVHSRAAQILNYADRLEALNREGPVSVWQDQARQLQNIRDNVNKMAPSLCRLQAIKSVALPWQQQVIDRILPMAMDLAAETKLAIKLLDTHQGRTYAVSEYTTGVEGIYSIADGVARSVRHFPEYAQARKALEKPQKGAPASGM